MKCPGTVNKKIRLTLIGDIGNTIGVLYDSLSAALLSFFIKPSVWKIESPA